MQACGIKNGDQLHEHAIEPSEVGWKEKACDRIEVVVIEMWSPFGLTPPTLPQSKLDPPPALFARCLQPM